MKSKLLNHRRRLERVGNPDSFSNRKLRVAATQIAKVIAEAFKYNGKDEYFQVCGDFKIVYREKGSAFEFYAAGQYCSHTRFYDSRWISSTQGLSTARAFAEAITDGLLDFVAKRIRECYGEEAFKTFGNSVGMSPEDLEKLSRSEPEERAQ